MGDPIGKILNEYESATRKFGKFASAHEGYAVILEELDELWDAVKDKNMGIDCLRDEAIQVGAMALRFLVDICGEDDPLRGPTDER